MLGSGAEFSHMWSGSFGVELATLRRSYGWPLSALYDRLNQPA